MPLKTHQDEQPTLNLTPMIDIVFLLIIFFMVGTKFAEWENKLALKVPQVKETGALAPAPEKRVINVYRDGRISLDRDFVTLEELTARLTAVQAAVQWTGSGGARRRRRSVSERGHGVGSVSRSGNHRHGYLGAVWRNDSGNTGNCR